MPPLLQSAPGQLPACARRAPRAQLRCSRGARALARPAVARARGRSALPGRLVTRCEIGGEYLDTYDDVDRTLMNYMTYRALRMTLQQLQETDTSPGKQEYTWMYQFAVDNPPSDSTTFLRALLNARQDLGVRLMEQRLVIFQRWFKGFKPSAFNDAIKASNKELLLGAMLSTINMDLEVPDKFEPGEPFDPQG